MQILPFEIPKLDKNFLVYQEDHRDKFYDRLHQHQEFQMSFIDKGSGILFVGDALQDFAEGDIILLGGNLPHLFRNDRTNQKAKMISLFFNLESPSSLFNTEDLNPYKRFLEKANNGLKFIKVSPELRDRFRSLKKKDNPERVIELLSIIKELMVTKSLKLSNFDLKKTYSQQQGKRMQDILEYTIENIKSTVSLDEAAKEATMTKNAFCKYFKKHTDRTYMGFVNELRINNATKLLTNFPDKMIVEIAEESGFNNLSNFNRQFKKYKNLTPLDYRKKFRE